MRALGSKKTFSKIILSYIVVLVIPLIFGMSLYLTTLGIYKKNVDESNAQVLDNVRDSVNISLSGVSSMMRALLNENNITTLASKESYTYQDYTVMNSIQHTLSMSLLSNAYIDEIILYFHRSDYLLTSKSYLDQINTMSGYSDTIGLDFLEFAQEVDKDEDYALKLLSTGRSTTPFLFVHGGADHGGTSDVTVFVRLKTKLLTQMMVSDGCQTFLMDASGNSLSDSRAALQQKEEGWLLEGVEEDGLFIETEDPTFRVRYVRFIPTKIYFQNLSTLQFIALAFLGLCLVCGVPLAISSARRSYHPIREILALIPQPSESHDSDDYKTIRTSLTNLLQQNQDYEAELDNHSRSMRSYLFLRLIESSGMKEKTFLEECRRCEISFENTSFLVIGFSVDNGSNLFFEIDESTNEQTSPFLFAAVTNVLRKVIGQDYPFFTAEYHERYYTVVNVNSRLDREVAVDEIKSACLLLADHMDSDFRAIVSISISNVHTGYQKIRRCYEEVEEIFREQDESNRTAYVIQYHELDTKKHGGEGALPDLDSVELLAKKDPEKRHIAQEVCVYIDEHYSDPNLTVGALAEHFHMATANLSLHFKRKLGLSPLEYIQLKRVSEAKILIDSTQMRIADIAKSVGYYDPRPLIRSFRRIEGMTPAEYRSRQKTNL